MSLLSIIQGVARRVNYPQPTAAIGNADPNVALMIDCTQDTGDELVERWGWQEMKLQTAATFTGDGTTPTFPLPANLETLQPDAIFVSSMYPTYRMVGPVNEDALLRQKLIPGAIYPSIWRIVGNAVEFWPVLQPGEVVSYIYQGSLWIKSGSPAVSVATFAADTDTVTISERLIRLGARWRWRQAKGLAYAEEMKDYELAFDRIAGQQTTERNIKMSRDFIGTFDDDGPAYIVGTIQDFGDFNNDFSNDFSQ